MASSIAAIHVAKKQLGLDDDVYRAKLFNITGKRSVKDMTEAQRQSVLSVFRNEGFEPKAAERRPDGRQKLAGKYAKKLQALWIAAWNLGLVGNRDDVALLAFVKRQTGIEHTRFLQYHDDASVAIEGLKAWINREAKVGYGNTNGYDWLKDDCAKVAWAQWRKLKPEASLVVRNGFDEEIARIMGEGSTAYLSSLTGAQWRLIMNELGHRVRALKKGGAK